MTEPVDKFHPVREFAARTRSEVLYVDSSKIPQADNFYVAWLDLMGAGHVMTTSVQKSANSLSRLHVAVQRSRADINFTGDIMPINDGVFIISSRKKEVMSILGRSIILLALNFIATPKPHDKFLLRGSIAYGPVYFGKDLVKGVKSVKKLGDMKFADGIKFGPALIQAFLEEKNSSPYGVAIHESARAFFPPGDEPFRLTHWKWWAPNEDVDYQKNTAPLGDVKECLMNDILCYLDWMKETAVYHGVEVEKIRKWKDIVSQYFS